jgi:hypothetical protein
VVGARRRTLRRKAKPPLTPLLPRASYQFAKLPLKPRQSRPRKSPEALHLPFRQAAACRWYIFGLSRRLLSPCPRALGRPAIATVILIDWSKMEICCNCAQVQKTTTVHMHNVFVFCKRAQPMWAKKCNCAHSGEEHKCTKDQLHI